MDSKQILTSDLLDVIFDQRNKAYGAYELRRHYNRRIGRALLVTATIVGVTITSVTLANKWKPAADPIAPKESLTIIEIPKEEKLPEPKPETPPPADVQPPKSEIYVEPKIVEDHLVEEPMTTIEALDSAAVSTVKRDGPVDIGLSQPTADATVGEGKGIIEEPAPKDPGPFVEVQVQAKFIGNWEKFLLRNLNGNVPVDNGANPGRYQVVVQFVVDIDGSVSDIKPISNAGFGMEQEAIRVLKKATKWEPAIQNGRQVKAYRRQPITFQVDGE
ncbi:energy transducer TonB [Terrimonas sp. NA20]|uniref:Energy transducer TonB n=1 Tax=Terrimonas ginsenosidimutans TaxID=2908004 RepID=A0ABS9KL01_9BACT|nr:energy transducer TonB [Terrimonas ginsenosidimutans]MCG2612995.1 energy transducer TonB [Terrimonas ginsenosidimutans]